MPISPLSPAPMKIKISNEINQAGFTLVEMLVTMAIFVTAITAIANIVLYSNRLQRQTQALQKTQSDARFALEVMAQQIRRGNIDYIYYGGSIPSNPQSVLALLNKGGEQIQFRRVVSAGRGEIQIWQEGDADWTAITPPEISIENLDFYLSPATDPFAPGYTQNSQPLATIALTSVNISRAGQELTPLFLQTTIASRQYLR